MDAVKKKKQLFPTHKNQEGVSVSLSQRPSHGSSMNSTREISLLDLGARQDPVRAGGVPGHLRSKPSIFSHQAQFGDGRCLAVYSTTVVNGWAQPLTECYAGEDGCFDLLDHKSWH